MPPPFRELIRLERETLAELRDALNGAAMQTAAMLGIVGPTRAAFLQVLRQIANQLEADVTIILIKYRDQATRLALHHVPDEHEIVPEDDEVTEDRGHAVAALLAATWLLMAQGSTGKNIRANTRLQDWRLKRIAATELYQAYGSSALRAYEQLPATEMKRWDATLDHTCAACLSHHGETVPVHQDFRDGDVPGDMHPNCRCVPTLIEKP